MGPGALTLLRRVELILPRIILFMHIIIPLGHTNTSMLAVLVLTSLSTIDFMIDFTP